VPESWWSREAQHQQPYPGQHSPYQPYQQPYRQQNEQTSQFPIYPPGYPYADAQQSYGGSGGTATMARPSKTRRGGRLVAGAVALAVVAGGVGGGVGVALNQQSPTALTSLGSATAKAQPAVAAIAGSVQQVAATVLPSVVEIQVMAGNQGDGGSGAVLSADGLILTNNHVVEAAAAGGTITVTRQDGTSATATIVGRDPSSDIAVIKMANQTNLTPIALGSSSNLAVGQDVVAVGSPFGLNGTVTSGIVSALHRPVRTGGATSGQSTVLDAIQTDAAINPGNSGGPLVNMNGQLIGINTANAGGGGGASGGQAGSIGLGFAIPVDQAQRVAQQLISKGSATQAVLGVSITDTGASGQGTSAGPSTSAGATIAAVSPGGAAAKAGVQVGSMVIKVDDRPIPDGDSLIAAVRSHAPGDTITITLTDATGGAPHTVQVTLQGATVQAGH